MSDNNSASGSIIVAGSAIGALAGGIPGAISGAIIGAVIQELIKCPKCGGKMYWNQLLKKNVCIVCGHSKN